MALDRCLRNTLPDFQSAPAAHPSDLVAGAATQMLQLLQSKLERRGEVDWSDVSVYTGAAGYALLYYFLFRRTGQNEHLQLCHKYISLATDRRGGGRVTFLCGAVGPLAVAAAAHAASNDVVAASRCLQKILSYLPQVLDLGSGLPDELLYGRTGFLYALNFLRQEAGAVSSGLITDDVVRQVLSAVIESGRRTASASASPSPLFYFWHDTPYVGAAHGLCGIVYHLLLNDRLLRKDELEGLVKGTLDYILTLAFESGNVRSSCSKEADRLVHWCHGAPGFVYTAVEGHRVFGDQRYLDAAVRAGDVVWQRGLLKKGYGLCHGVAGNAYAFLCLWRATGDAKHLHRAMQFAEFCAHYGTHGCRTPDAPWSLFEGLAGTVYFMFDIQKPSEARFPAYELRRS